MNWIDEGYLISKSKYNENSIVAEFYTKNRGKCSGIIFGSTSKKNRSYLQIGNKLHLNYNYKNESKIGSFKVEIIKVITPLYFDNKKKLLCLNTAINLVKILTADLQSNKNIYDLINNFFEILPLNHWIKEYIYWELKLLKQLGYDLELKSLVNEEKKDNKIKYYVKSQNGIKTIPNFLINHNTNDVDESDLINGLNLVGDYLDKSVFKPNNINYPNSRTDFINILK